MKLRSVPFDEKLSVISLILARLGSAFQQSYLQDQFVTGLFEELKSLKAAMTEEGAPRPGQVLEAFTQQYHETLKAKKEAQQIDRLEEHSMLQVEKALESYYTVLRAEHLAEPLAAFDRIRSLFQEEVERRSQIIEETSAMLDHAFDFMEAVFPDSQEMVVFITELTVNFYSAKFISENGCEHAQFFLDLLAEGTRPDYPNRTAVETELGTWLSLAYSGDMTAAEALAEFQIVADELMAE